jgi:hypothetical protein
MLDICILEIWKALSVGELESLSLPLGLHLSTIARFGNISSNIPNSHQGGPFLVLDLLDMLPICTLESWKALVLVFHCN